MFDDNADDLFDAAFFDAAFFFAAMTTSPARARAVVVE